VWVGVGAHAHTKVTTRHTEVTTRHTEVTTRHTKVTTRHTEVTTRHTEVTAHRQHRTPYEGSPEEGVAVEVVPQGEPLCGLVQQEGMTVGYALE
jgi:hypothetical protein